jgi:DNA-binding transcriptional LysR family regulator
MELRQLRYFVAVAEEHNFGRASERLRIAQSGLSQQIRALEASVGATLFNRDTRPIELTEAGEVLLEQARLVLAAAGETQAAVRRVGHGRRGPLRIATGAGGMTPATRTLLDRFAERNPDVDVEFHPGFVPNNLDALERRAVDVAFVSMPFEPRRGINVLRLETFEALVVVADDHPLAVFERIPRRELRRFPFAIWPRSVNPILTDHLLGPVFGDAGHDLLYELPDASQESRIDAARQGAATFGFGPETMVDVAGVTVRSVEDPVPTLEYALAWSESPTSNIVPRFVSLARELTSASTGGRVRVRR